jgi:hypothetical protein
MLRDNNDGADNAFGIYKNTARTVFVLLSPGCIMPYF